MGPTSYPSPQEPYTAATPVLTSALCLGGLHCMYDDSSIVSRSTHVSAALLSPSPWPSPPLLPPITLPESPPLATPCPAFARLMPFSWYQEWGRGEKALVFPSAASQKSRDRTGALRAPSHYSLLRILPLVFWREGKKRVLLAKLRAESVDNHGSITGIYFLSRTRFKGKGKGKGRGRAVTTTTKTNNVRHGRCRRTVSRQGTPSKHAVTGRLCC